MGSISLDQEIQVSSVVVQFLTIAASGLFVGLEIRSAKKREIESRMHQHQLEMESRIHQQRKEQYAKLVNLIMKLLLSVRIQSINSKSKNSSPFSQDEWLDVQMGMSMYASQEVLNAYLKFLKTSQGNESLILINRELGDLILMMRKEAGFNDSNLTSRQVLGTFINDINDSKYDQYFK